MKDWSPRSRTSNRGCSLLRSDGVIIENGASDTDVYNDLISANGDDGVLVIGASTNTNDLEYNTQAVGAGSQGHMTALGHEPHNYTIFYVDVDDMPAALAKAESLEARPSSPPSQFPTGPSPGSPTPRATRSDFGRRRSEGSRIVLVDDLGLICETTLVAGSRGDAIDFEVGPRCRAAG